MNAIQERPRKQAPKIDVTDYYKDERKQMVEDAKKALGDKARDVHFCFQRASEEPAMWERRGYTSVTELISKEEDKKKIWDHKGDPLTFCTRKQSDRDREAPAIIAHEAVKGAMDGSDEKYQTTDAEGGRHGLINEG